jgi:hypothetical protein
MATVDGLTKARMLAIEAASVVGGSVDNLTGHLILTTHDATEIDAGYVLGTVVDATTTLKGIIEIATDVEAATGTDTTRAVTPANLAPLFAAKQPLDGDLTDISGLAPTANDVLQYIAGHWANRTMAQLKTALAIAQSDVSGLTAALAALQPLDGDLTTIAALAPTNGDTLMYNAGAWANRTAAQVKTALAIAQSDVSGLTAALALLAPLASPTFTGTMTLSGRQVITPDAISISGGNASIDASTGNVFAIAATAAFTLANPTNPTDGQVLHLRITQDGTGSRVMTLGSAWSAGPNTITLSTGANKIDHLVAMYHSGTSKWHITGFQPGF